MSDMIDSGAAVAPAALHEAFGQAFADYLIGPFQLAPEQWPGFLARQGVDLGLSRVLRGADGAILAFAFVAPRPALRVWRLATMGAVPAARGSGAAPRLLDDFIARAAAAGQDAVELEVFAQNERALRLYQGRGFVARHALHGYLAAPERVRPAPAPGLRVVSLEQAFDWLARAEAHIPELPLQVTATALRVAPGLTAWQCGAAQLVFGRPDAQTVTIASLIDTGPGQQDAAALLRALREACPAAQLRVPQLQRLDLGGAALRDQGFEPQALHQLLMRRPLPTEE